MDHFNWGRQFEEMAADAIIEYFQFIISDYKHPAFAEEQEYRLELSIFDYLKEKSLMRIDYLTDGTLIKPYINNGSVIF